MRKIGHDWRNAKESNLTKKLSQTRILRELAGSKPSINLQEMRPAEAKKFDALKIA